MALDTVELLKNILETNQTDDRYKKFVEGFLDDLEVGEEIDFPLLKGSENEEIGGKQSYDAGGLYENPFVSQGVYVLTSLSPHQMGVTTGGEHEDVNGTLTEPVSGGFTLLDHWYNEESGDWEISDDIKWVTGVTVANRRLGFSVQYDFFPNVEKLKKVSTRGYEGWLAENINTQRGKDDFLIVLVVDTREAYLAV